MTMRWIGLLLSLLAVVSISHATPTSTLPRGSAPSVEFNAINVVGCEAFQTNIGLSFSSPQFEDEYFVFTEVFIDGVMYMDELFQRDFLQGTQTLNWSFYDANSRGLQSAFFPLPPNQPIGLRVGIVDPAQQRVVSAFQVRLSRCNDGVLEGVDSYFGAYNPQPTDPAVYFDQVSSTGCNSGFIGNHFRIVSSRHRENDFRTTDVFVDGRVYMDESFAEPTPAGVEPLSWGHYDANDRGLQTRPFPLPPNRPVILRMGLNDPATQQTLSSYQVVLDRCNGGTAQQPTYFSGPYDPTPSDPRIELVNVLSVGCNEAGTQIRWNAQGAVPYSDLAVVTEVEAMGDLYMDELLPINFVTGSNERIWSFYNSNDRGYQNAQFPLPQNQPLRMRVAIVDPERRHIVDGLELNFDRCNGGSLQSVVKIQGLVERLFTNGFEENPFGRDHGDDAAVGAPNQEG